ncbi:MAG: hypothetical protein JOZ69_08790 [Myxococcales bacterium]|nr:hypothetical protein [Myxococcales bacterium]
MSAALASHVDPPESPSSDVARPEEEPGPARDGAAAAPATPRRQPEHGAPPLADPADLSRIPHRYPQAQPSSGDGYDLACTD